ncbi:hypothetical protein [Ensifer sp. B1-9]|uniref:hypothetical protein n=1 Tax=Ensifer sp. B1-9 TaxID=3141455 RepID=UPI003D1BC648
MADLAAFEAERRHGLDLAHPNGLDAAAQLLGDLLLVIETERDGYPPVGSTPMLFRHCGIFPLVGRHPMTTNRNPLESAATAVIAQFDY